MSDLRGGKGDLEFLHYDTKDKMKHCRLLGQITIPKGSSIGEHVHDGETEYFIITEGEGVVVDNGEKTTVGPGDVVKTGDGASHSIGNEKDSPLRMVAVIITY